MKGKVISFSAKIKRYMQTYLVLFSSASAYFEELHCFWFLSCWGIRRWSHFCWRAPRYALKLQNPRSWCGLPRHRLPCSGDASGYGQFHGWCPQRYQENEIWHWSGLLQSCLNRLRKKVNIAKKITRKAQTGQSEKRSKLTQAKNSLPETGFLTVLPGMPRLDARRSRTSLLARKVGNIARLLVLGKMLHEYIGVKLYNW